MRQIKVNEQSQLPNNGWFFHTIGTRGQLICGSPSEQDADYALELEKLAEIAKDRPILPFISINDLIGDVGSILEAIHGSVRMNSMVYCLADIVCPPGQQSNQSMPMGYLFVAEVPNIGPIPCWISSCTPAPDIIAEFLGSAFILCCIKTAIHFSHEHTDIYPNGWPMFDSTFG